MRAVDDYRQRTDEELKEELRTLEEEKLNLRFQKVIGQLENTSRITQVKRNIARILTILRERELEKKGKEKSDE